MFYWNWKSKSPDYIEGFKFALRTFGVWREGQQVIGCMDTPIKEIFKEIEDQRKELDVKS